MDSSALLGSRFFRNHREAIVALDFFTVPTVTFSFFVIEHGRRHILHFNTACHASAEWVVQAVARGLSRRRSASLCHPGSQFDLRKRGHHLLEGDRIEGQANESDPRHFSIPAFTTTAG